MEFMQSVYKGWVTYKLWASLLLLNLQLVANNIKCTHIHTKMGLLSSFRPPSWQDWTWTSALFVIQKRKRLQNQPYHQVVVSPTRTYSAKNNENPRVMLQGHGGTMRNEKDWRVNNLKRVQRSLYSWRMLWPKSLSCLKLIHHSWCNFSQQF